MVNNNNNNNNTEFLLFLQDRCSICRIFNQILLMFKGVEKFASHHQNVKHSPRFQLHVPTELSPVHSSTQAQIQPLKVTSILFTILLLLLWLLHYPDLALNQLRLHIKRKPRLLQQLSSHGAVCNRLQVLLNLPSYGSDLRL